MTEILIEDSHIKHLEETILLNTKEMRIVSDCLDIMGIQYIPSVANFITIVFDSRVNVINLVQYLLENGIIVRDLIGFGLPKCIRVTIGTREENKLFLNEMKKYFN